MAPAGPTDPLDPLPLAPRPRPPRITPLWLSHHYPEDYDRCVRLGRSHVCRRCLVLYPVAFVVMVLTLSWHPPVAIDVLFIAVLPLPALVELVAEQIGLLRYRPRRQLAVTLPLAVGLGRGFAVYLDDHASLLFWGVVVIYTAVGAGAVLIHHRRGGTGGTGSSGPEGAHGSAR